MSIIERLKAKVQKAPYRHTIVDMANAEKLLGFPLPDLLQKVYVEVGYGWPLLPRFGLFNVWTAINEYRASRADKENGMPPYPEKLLPICTWGCGISSAIDCSCPEGPIIRTDPNLDELYVLEHFDLPSSFKFYSQYSNEEIASWYEAGSLGDWLEDWLNGTDLFHSSLYIYHESNRPVLPS